MYNRRYNNYRLQQSINFQEKETDVNLDITESRPLVTCCSPILKIEALNSSRLYFVLYAILYYELKIENILFLKYTDFRL